MKFEEVNVGDKLWFFSDYVSDPLQMEEPVKVEIIKRVATVDGWFFDAVMDTDGDNKVCAHPSCLYRTEVEAYKELLAISRMRSKELLKQQERLMDIIEELEND